MHGSEFATAPGKERFEPPMKRYAELLVAGSS
jgi:hypothetical protein